MEELQQGSSVDTELLEGDAEQQDFAEGMGFLLAFLFYFAALGFGYTLSGSIVEEKANRIVEIITTKIPVRQLLIGKIAGNTLLAIGQTALIVAVGLVGISFTEYSSYLSGISEGVGWFAVFFLVGFAFIACWWAVAGALASRAEDLQTTAAPLNFLMLAVFFGAFLFEGTVQTVASYVPPFSIVLMPIRVLNGDAAVWEPIAALGHPGRRDGRDRGLRRAALPSGAAPDAGPGDTQAGLDRGRLTRAAPAPANGESQECIDTLPQSAAEDKDTLTVSQETADKYSLTSIADLEPVAGELVVGAGPEFRERFQGLVGLKEVYGVDFKEFKPLDPGGPLTVGALEDGTVDVANIFSTDSAISVNDWVVLEDPENLYLSQNILPLIRSDAVTPEVEEALNGVSEALTTENLTAALARVQVDKDDPVTVAKEFLEENGLI